MSSILYNSQTDFKEAVILFRPALFKFENNSKNTFDVSKIINKASPFPRNPTMSMLDTV